MYPQGREKKALPPPREYGNTLLPPPAFGSEEVNEPA